MRNEKVDNKLNKIRQVRQPYGIYMGGISIVVFPKVYPTSELSELICECMDDPNFGIRKGDRVLDYGTGTGFLAVQAALRGATVVATDINPYAVKCAEENAHLHSVSSRITIREGDGFSPLRSDEKFDIIVAELPWDCAHAEDVVELSMYDPEFHMRKILFKNALEVLQPHGRIFMTYARFIQQRYPIEQFGESFIYRVVRERVIKGEPHYAYLINPAPAINLRTASTES
ncbi:hypothetical protein A6769_32550 [Nostoc punctiforme NIES-2108]|uniref:Methyltransferase domain-containing protein n=1 Tax=Nostoc punctiforme NIES-2108 TaxID=1356359 RepID=A0A367R4F7_NOSPU|nr:hypothetical protein A6769_32550 [Nostoc punctiforme NIES-2108]